MWWEKAIRHGDVELGRITFLGTMKGEKGLYSS